MSPISERREARRAYLKAKQAATDAHHAWQADRTLENAEASAEATRQEARAWAAYMACLDDFAEAFQPPTDAEMTDP